jgi:hypothetical protein
MHVVRRFKTSGFAPPGIALLALLSGCGDAYVFMDLLPNQPNQADLGKIVSVEAASTSALQVRLTVRGGKISGPNDAPTAAALCRALSDGKLDTLLFVQPDNVEAVVTAELVDGNENCSQAVPDGPAFTLVVSSASTLPTTTTSGGGGAAAEGGGGQGGTGGAPGEGGSGGAAAGAGGGTAGGGGA